MGAIFITGGYGAATNPGGRTKAVEAAGMPEAETLVRVNGAAQVAGGLALTLGILPRAAALGLAASMVPTTVVGHPFWKVSDPGKKKLDQLQFLKNAAIVGGLLAMAGAPKGVGCCKRRRSKASR